MEKRIAQIISLVFHPLLITTYTFFFMFSFKTIFNLMLTMHGKLIVLGSVFVMSCAFPVLLILLLKHRGMVKTFEMETREERVLPLLMATIFYYSTYYMLHQVKLPAMFQQFVLGSTFLIALVLLINFWWKISIHTVAMGGMIGCMICLSMQFDNDMRLMIACLIMAAGLVSYARLKLEAHTQSQVYFGFFVGLVVMSGIFLIF